MGQRSVTNRERGGQLIVTAQRGELQAGRGTQHIGLLAVSEARFLRHSVTGSLPL